MAKFAVFTRNYRQHIESAGSEGVFRSNVCWAKPASALAQGEQIDVYIAPVEGNGEVAFRGKLTRVKLDPAKGDAEVLEMLTKCPETTQNEGLWEDDVATLYEVSDIESLAAPFHFTELKKLDGGEGISPEYSRSYCLVSAIE